MPAPSTPRVSVIIPALDAALTLGRTLDSLAAQTARDWEAVVVDDGSSDGTGAVAAAAAAADPRVRWLAQPNAGVSAARNAGLAEARSEFVLFLDADDTIGPDHLARLLAPFGADDPPEAAYCGHQRLSPDGEVMATYHAEAVEESPFLAFARLCPVAIHCVAVRRDLVRSVGGFDAGLRTCEDWDLWQRIARTGARFERVPGLLAPYRMRAGSLSSQARAVMTDGLVVMARGTAADSRVPHPDPRHADGISHGHSAVYLASWLVALEAASGTDASSLLDLIGPLPDMEAEAEWLIPTLVDGLVVGSLAPPDRLAEAWPRFEAPIATLVRRLGAASRDPDLARRLIYNLQLALLRASRLERPVSLSLVMGARIDPLRPAPLVPSGAIDAAHLRFGAGTDGPAVREIALWGPVPGPALADLAAEALGPGRPEPAGGTEDAPAAGRGPDRARALIAEERQAQWRLARGEAAARDLAPPPPPPLPPSPSPDRPGPEPGRAGEPIPVLLYPRLAEGDPDGGPDGPGVTAATFAAHVWLMRHHGWEAIGSAALEAHLRGGGPLPERPVLIAFDHAGPEFERLALPVLREFGFVAEVFVSTDRIAPDGAGGDGDGAGLGWPEVRALRSAGIRFGSRLASGRHADGLTSDDLLREAARSRAALESRLGEAVVAFAAPHGHADGRLVHVMRTSGYRIGFADAAHAAALDGDPLAVPRIAVDGGWTFDDFARVLGLRWPEEEPP